MEASSRKKNPVTKPLSCNNNSSSINGKTSKVQYFTFGKDNCLIHHPTNQSKKGTPSAVFSKTNPFSAQSNKTCHRKQKSTFQIPYRQNAAIKRVAISKITKNLEQTSLRNSDYPSIVIKGVAIKLEPKKQSVISPYCGSSYCRGVRRCKMCGDILLDIHSSMSSVAKDFNIDEIPSNIRKEVESRVHEHIPNIKRCVMCFKLFKEPSSTIVCDGCSESVLEHNNNRVSTNKEELPSFKTNLENVSVNERMSRLRTQASTYSKLNTNKDVQKDKPLSSSKFTMDETRSFDKSSQTKSDESSKRTYKVISGVSLRDQSRTYTKLNTIESVSKNKPPSNSKSTIENINKAKSFDKKPSQTKSDTSSQKTYKVASHISLQSKSLPASIRLTSKPKIPTEMYSSNRYATREQTKNTNTASKKDSAKISRTSTCPKSSEPNLTTKSKSVTDELTSENYFKNKEYYSKNLANKTSSTKTADMSSKAKSLSKTKQPNQDKRDADVLLSSCLNVKQCKSTSILNGKAIKPSNMQMQTYSLPEIDLQSINSYISSESYSSEDLSNREQSKNANINTKGSSLATSSSSIQTTSSSLSDTSESHVESETAPETYDNKEAENTDETSREDPTEAIIETSQLNIESSSKSATDAQKNSVEAQNPASTNVTVNNYYFLSSCDLKNLSADRKNHSVSALDHPDMTKLSINSENDVGNDTNQTTEKQNESSIKQLSPRVCLGNSKTHSLQTGFAKSTVVLGGLFKYKTENYLLNSCGSQFDIKILSKDSVSTLEDHPCLIDGVAGMSSNLHVLSGRQETPVQDVDLFVGKDFQHQNLLSSLYGMKTPKPFVQKSVRIFEEMDNILNEPIDPEKILEELKKNEELMKVINQMATKKLNFPRKTAVFKDLISK